MCLWLPGKPKAAKQPRLSVTLAPRPRRQQRGRPGLQAEPAPPSARARGACARLPASPPRGPRHPGRAWLLTRSVSMCTSSPRSGDSVPRGRFVCSIGSFPAASRVGTGVSEGPRVSGALPPRAGAHARRSRGVVYGTFSPQRGAHAAAAGPQCAAL